MASDYLEVYRSVGRGAALDVDQTASSAGLNVIPLQRKNALEHYAN
jgi:hypothetical protein